MLRRLNTALKHRYWQFLTWQHKRRLRFSDSRSYWEQRYRSGGNSGTGSYGEAATFKADVLNRFVAAHDVQSVIEFGSGDGNQLKLYRFPAYAGFDVSQAAVERCRRLLGHDPTRRFELVDRYKDESADLALSIDVVYHLVEDDVFQKHMRLVFGAARRFAIVYSTDIDLGVQSTLHVRHRQFSDWVRANRPDFRLVQRVADTTVPPNGPSPAAEFFVFERSL